MKTYLVTGGCGFIGVNLIPRLIEQGVRVRVRVLDNLSLGRREDVEPLGVDLHLGDIRDPIAVAKDYFKRTGLFPIMHVIGIRRTLAEKHPWLPGAVFKAFEQAKAVGLEKLSDTSATKVTLPFVEEALKNARTLMGEDYWSYGVEHNRKVLDYFLGQHHAQGLSSRRVSVDELFHPGTYEAFKL